MEGLIVHKTPDQTFPTMLVAFAGWPDAAESATRALRYMVRKLPASKFAEIDSEDFFDFTMVRPQTRMNRKGERTIRWPTNNFYAYTSGDESKNLIIFVGTEPNLKWRTYSNILTGVAKQYGVKLVVSLGALLDAVPHTREPKITGRASSDELNQKAAWMGIKNSGYQGPTGIHSAFMDVCTKSGLPYASIWGHSPHYVNTSPNPKVSLALLEKLRSLVDFEIDFKELRISGDTYIKEVTKTISSQSDVSAYVARLERRHDDATVPEEEMPSPESMVAELEQFLRSQRRSADENDDN